MQAIWKVHFGQLLARFGLRLARVGSLLAQLFLKCPCLFFRFLQMFLNFLKVPKSSLNFPKCPLIFIFYDLHGGPHSMLPSLLKLSACQTSVPGVLKFCFGPLSDPRRSLGTKKSAIDVKNPKESENRAQNPQKCQKHVVLGLFRKWENLETCLTFAQ